jgi:hypothetical protein
MYVNAKLCDYPSVGSQFVMGHTNITKNEPTLTTKGTEGRITLLEYDLEKTVLKCEFITAAPPPKPSNFYLMKLKPLN